MNCQITGPTTRLQLTFLNVKHIVIVRERRRTVFLSHRSRNTAGYPGLDCYGVTTDFRGWKAYIFAGQFPFWIPCLQNEYLNTDTSWSARFHYNDVMMGMMASQITSLTIVYSTVYAGANQRKHQSSASLALCGGFTGHLWIPRTNGQ